MKNGRQSRQLHFSPDDYHDFIDSKIVHIRSATATASPLMFAQCTAPDLVTLKTVSSEWGQTCHHLQSSCDKDWLSRLDDDDVATNLPLQHMYMLTGGLVVAACCPMTHRQIAMSSTCLLPDLRQLQCRI